MKPLGTYSFLPWLRSGLAGQITQADGAAIADRATVRVELEVAGQAVAGGTTLTRPVARDVALYGPGDVVGIDPRAIVRTEPRDWITNYEPNYLAHIEFYDEDFPWRYTPAAPDPSRLKLRPWIALVVLEQAEFRDLGIVGDGLLPSISVINSAALPNAEELWAWAHVHVNTTLAASDAEFTSNDMPAVTGRLRAALAANRDLAYSRIVCPRHLKADTAYHAFVVPVFETGRLAGLGLTGPAGAYTATTSAWATYPDKPEASAVPVYQRWYFHTGGQGDFEYLVRLLKPGVADKRVGVRPMDVRNPGANLPGIDDADLGGILKLGGALRFPRSSYTAEELKAFDRYDQWAHRPPAPRDYPQPFQEKLARFVNLPEDYATATAADANQDSGLGLAVQNETDPLITAPLYGRWHALTQRLLADRAGAPVDPDDNWVHELNLDPRHRVAAGFGTRVVQTNQEAYMQAAWEQIGDVLSANRRIRLAQLAQFAATSWHAGRLEKLGADDPAKALTLMAPAHGHIVGDAGTVRHQLAGSLVDPALTSVAMRRVTRPGGRLMRRLYFSREVTPTGLLERVAAGEVSAAPPKTTPEGLVTVDQVAKATGTEPLESDQGSTFVSRRPRLRRWLVWLATILLLLAGIARFLRARGLAAWLAKLARRILAWARPGPPERDAPADATEEGVSGGVVTLTFRDKRVVDRFNAAIGDWGGLFGASAKAGREPELRPVGIVGLATTAITALNPLRTIPKRTFHAIRLPAHLIAGLVEDFGEVMHYPRIDTPMYEPLRDVSDELFLPNLNLLKPNSVTLLETNQRFIEAYMVGLNHEMSRELLWREYPTDQRGTPFRQFWESRDALNPEHLSQEALKEKLRDIPELHRWPRRSKLGDHDHRERPGDNEEEAVLVIRGELLKKYPNAVIYAHKARWPNNVVDPTKERELVPLTDAEEADPPFAVLRTPLYEARVLPDITFFGFDLTVPEARGDGGANAGWFFCIKERPGEPRFGFDISRTGPVQTVNDLAWPDAGAADGAFLGAGALGSIPLAVPGADEREKDEQHADDKKVVTTPVSAARWAYLLYQAPVLVAIHAHEMLPEK